MATKKQLKLSESNQQRFKTLLLEFLDKYHFIRDKSKFHYSENLSFTKDLHFDSLDQVEFIMEVEKHFAVGIPDMLAIDVKTINDAYGVLAKVLKENN